MMMMIMIMMIMTIMIINIIMALLSRSDCEDRFQLYLDKTFNKTVRNMVITVLIIDMVI